MYTAWVDAMHRVPFSCVIDEVFRFGDVRMNEEDDPEERNNKDNKRRRRRRFFEVQS